MAKDLEFLEARGETVDCLRAIQMNLSRCVDEGMIDEDSFYYNEILNLIDEATLSKNWNELEEVITKAKTLEVDVDAWLSGHGQTTLSMQWPKPPKSR